VLFRSRMARWQVKGAGRLFSPWLGRWLYNLPIWYIPVGRSTSLLVLFSVVVVVVAAAVLFIIFFSNTFFFPVFYLSPNGLSWVTNLFTWLKRSSFVHLPPSSPLPPIAPSLNLVVHRLYPITSHNLKDKSLRLH